MQQAGLLLIPSSPAGEREMAASASVSSVLSAFSGRSFFLNADNDEGSRRRFFGRASNFF